MFSRYEDEHTTLGIEILRIGNMIQGINPF